MATYKVRVTDAKLSFSSVESNLAPTSVELPGTMPLTKNFSVAEFCNKQATDEVKGALNARVIKFAHMLQELRDWFNKPMTVNSWYRTVSFNKKCGGDARSLHLDGLAMDWGIKHTKLQHGRIEEKWRAICEKHSEIGGINHYTNGYHLSIGEEKFGYTEFKVRDYRGKKGDW